MNIYRLQNKARNEVRVVANSETEAKKIAVRQGHARNIKNLKIYDHTYGTSGDDIIKSLNVSGSISRAIGPMPEPVKSNPLFVFDKRSGWLVYIK